MTPIICWIVYYQDFSGIAVFAHEIDALRHAVDNGMSVKPAYDGDEIR